MKLEVHEPITLLGLLPKEGDYSALKTIRRAREMIAFTPEEQEFYKLKNKIGADGKPTAEWSTERASQQIKDVPIDEFTTNIIRDKLAELNKKKKLTEQYISLYEKFVIMYQ